MASHKFHLALLNIHHYAVAELHLVMQNFHSQWVLRQSLDGALERPRAEVGIIALMQWQILSSSGQPQTNLALGSIPTKVRILRELSKDSP